MRGPHNASVAPVLPRTHAESLLHMLESYGPDQFAAALVGDSGEACVLSKVSCFALLEGIPCPLLKPRPLPPRLQTLPSLFGRTTCGCSAWCRRCGGARSSI